MRTIVIDDDQSTLQVYNEYLEMLGFQDIKLVQRPSEYFANHTIDNMVNDYDLILCDIHMPTIKGNEILDQASKAMQRNKKFPALFLITGVPADYFDHSENGWASLSKADDILDKPMRFTDLAAALKRQGFHLKDMMD